MKNPFNNLVSMPFLWNAVQNVLGYPSFKRDLYRSKLTPGNRLLDFGCASGHLADAFLDFEYYGIDLNEFAIKAAADRFADKSNMHFLAADLRSRPFEKGFFDEILFAGTVHHLTDDLLVPILHELHYCLKKGGVIHIIDPVYRTTDSWAQRKLRSLDQGKFTRTTEEIISLLKPLPFSIGEPMYYDPKARIPDCNLLYLPIKSI